ncbi:TPA: acylneuraminate cytidylyltransferase family protein [Streptococcus suis]
MRVAIIPMRSGSKGVPHKNIRMIGGKPLACYTIDLALECQLFDEIVISTDSENYISLLTSYYRDKLLYVKRPIDLATDTSTMVETILHVFSERRYSLDTNFIAFQVTSPLRSVSFIRDFSNSWSDKYDACITVKPFDRNLSLVAPLLQNGLFHLPKLDNTKTNRQSQGMIYYPDGSMWMSTVGKFMKNQSFYTSTTFGYLSPEWSRYDVDTELDLFIVEHLMRRANESNRDRHSPNEQESNEIG